MKHDASMLIRSGPTVRTESRFVRYIHQILTYWPPFLRLARSSQNATSRKDNCMPELEIPTDEEVLAALGTSDAGLTPSQLLAVLEVDHTRENVIRAIQRVLDRGKVYLTDGARLVPAQIEELAAA